MDHESQIEPWSPFLTPVCFAGFGTDRFRCQEAMKTAGRENPHRRPAALSNRARGVEDQNRSCSHNWAAKQEKLQPLEACFFLTSPFIDLPVCPSLGSSSVHYALVNAINQDAQLSTDNVRLTIILRTVQGESHSPRRCNPYRWGVSGLHCHIQEAVGWDGLGLAGPRRGRPRHQIHHCRESSY